MAKVLSNEGSGKENPAGKHNGPALALPCPYGTNPFTYPQPSQVITDGLTYSRARAVHSDGNLLFPGCGMCSGPNPKNPIPPQPMPVPVNPKISTSYLRGPPPHLSLAEAVNDKKFAQPYSIGKQVIGLKRDKYTGDLFQVVTNVMPPPTSEKNARPWSSINRAHPMLASYEGTYSTPNPYKRRKEANLGGLADLWEMANGTCPNNTVLSCGPNQLKTMTLADLFALSKEQQYFKWASKAGPATFGDQVYADVRRSLITNQVSQPLYFNKTGELPSPQISGKEVPYGYIGYQNMVRFLPRLPQTQQLDNINGSGNNCTDKRIYEQVGNFVGSEVSSLANAFDTGRFLNVQPAKPTKTPFARPQPPQNTQLLPTAYNEENIVARTHTDNRDHRQNLVADIDKVARLQMNVPQNQSYTVPADQMRDHKQIIQPDSTMPHIPLFVDNSDKTASMVSSHDNRTSKILDELPVTEPSKLSDMIQSHITLPLSDQTVNILKSDDCDTTAQQKITMALPILNSGLVSVQTLADNIHKTDSSHVNQSLSQLDMPITVQQSVGYDQQQMKQDGTFVDKSFQQSVVELAGNSGIMVPFDPVASFKINSDSSNDRPMTFSDSNYNLPVQVNSEVQKVVEGEIYSERYNTTDEQNYRSSEKAETVFDTVVHPENDTSKIALPLAYPIASRGSRHDDVRTETVQYDSYKRTDDQLNQMIDRNIQVPQGLEIPFLHRENSPSLKHHKPSAVNSQKELRSFS